ncbi:MAG: AAA family ATPase [Scytolyngbya sp. HA4215-MV1]|jgi:protein kinase|nr:AAA family ATPase [Scytolyngbya sp. HA4215-MV1]
MVPTANTDPNRLPHIPGYSIVEQLYVGSRTIVYRAVENSSQRPVVIKLLQQSYPTFNELLQFRNQYTIAQNLNIPGIIRSYNLEFYGNGYALVMEDFGGVSLQQYVQTHTLALPETLAIALQLTEILHDLHQAHVIHKDIKPANILICPTSKQVKLIDFSIASLLPKETPELSPPHGLEGTLAYLAPEQTGRMNRGIDYRVDFYAFGATLFELLTGQLPFSSSDPMELVHCHLAKQPPTVQSLCPEIPGVLSEIVGKLMAKNAEDRYQSALGLRHDLQNCLSQLQETGQIEPFTIALRDVNDRFLLPEKLYGRAVEVHRLLAAFDRVANGTSELMLVAGSSGIGKTAVVNEVHKPIVRQRGYFIKGKFDQFNRNIPFSAFVQALRNLMQQLLTESDAQLVQWQAKILTVLGESGQVIIDVVPELAAILGPQPPVPELSGSEAQNRFHRLLQQFIHVFATAAHPLVIFLDDLQWADLASLSLIERLVEQHECRFLLLIGAYRSNEVSATHPLIRLVDKLGKAKMPIHTLTLPPLSQENINHLIADTLNCSVDAALSLTQLIDQKAQGNPFFTTQLLKSLHAEGLIALNQETHQWQCDMTWVQSLVLSDDVVAFMRLQLQKLPASCQEMLKLAACIGSQFDLTTLATVCEQPPTVVALNLWAALQAGLILPLNEIYKFFQAEAIASSQQSVKLSPRQVDACTYRFLHDRVQQAAYSLIAEDQRQTAHWQIGQLLLRNTPASEQEERLFEIVNHLNVGRSLIARSQEQVELAQLNLRAGQKARAATAYGAAVDYFTTGIACLPTDAWERHYDLTLALHREVAEAAYLNTDFEQMEQWATLVLQHAKTLLDTIPVQHTRLMGTKAQGQLLPALQLGLQVLQSLGVEFPAQPTQADIEQAFGASCQLWQDQAPLSLLGLPPMIDPSHLAAMKILSWLVPCAYVANPTLMVLLIFKQVELSIQHGNCPISIYGYVDYGLILCGVIGDIPSGYDFGQLALQLLAQSQVTPFKCRAWYVVYTYIQHWKTPLQESIPQLQEAYQSGLETGDIETTALSAAAYCYYAYWAGQELIELADTIEAYRQTIGQLKQTTSQLYLEIYQQTVFNLLGRNEVPVQLRGTVFNEAVSRPRLQAANHRTALFYLHFNQMVLGYLFGDYQQAAQDSLLAEHHLDGGIGTFMVPLYSFYDSLVQLARCRNASEEAQRQILDRVEMHQGKLKGWATHAPFNHQHHWQLVAAEQYRVLQQQAEAIEHFDLAIAGAQANGYLQDEALANELAAKFYLDWGKEKVAAGYMQDAYYCYVRWRAKAKTNDLEKRYPRLLHPILQPTAQPLNVIETLAKITNPYALNPTSELSRSSSTSVNTALDLTTILKASQSLSGTIQLDELLHQLTQIILQNSGSDRYALIRPDRQGQWQVQTIATPEATQLCSEPLEQHPNLPVKLIQYVKNTREVVVIDDLKTDLPILDEYLVQQQPKSILCLPILNQGKLLGILYLNNQSTRGVFTHDRILILNFLCTQAAISLENARLYQESQAHAQQVELALEQQQILFNVVTQMRESLDLETIFQSVTQNVRSILSADRVGIYQFHTEQNYEYGEFIAEDVRPEFPSALAIKVQDHCFSEDYATLYKQGRICTIRDVQAAEIPDCHRAILMQFGIQASLVVPILQDSNLWGLLCIHQCDRTRNWQPAESQFAQQVAAQMGIALQQTELLLETRRQATQLEQALRELQQAQLQLVQNEKMASLGNLVAGVAHEINNPIGFLNGSMKNVREYFQDLLGHLTLYQQHYPHAAESVQENAEDIELDYLCEDLPKLMDSMKGAIDRIKSISTSLRTFSRADTEHKVSANLHEGIDSALLILKYRLKANEHRPAIQVIQDYGELPLIECFPGQLNQVFMNLLANAIDMFDEMAQSLSFSELEANPQQITIRTTVDSNQVQIQILDNGKGMDEDVKAKIFDHLFTTKGVGKGTGLGLTIAYQIVTETHAGSLEVQSELGQGSEFCIRLPLSD